MVENKICVFTHSTSHFDKYKILLDSYQFEVNFWQIDSNFNLVDCIACCMDCKLILVQHDDFLVIKDFYENLRLITSAPIIYISYDECMNHIPTILDSGYDDCFSKNISTEEFIARIKCYIRRQNQTHHSKEVCPNFESLIIDTHHSTVIYKDISIPFTKKEFQIILLLARSPMRIFSKREIFDFIHSHYCICSSHSVVELISQIRKKLKKHNISAIKTHHGIEYSWHDNQNV